ncbi:MAG: homocysteine S-methyltransferase family protein [Candidatus Margulisbacteria bacterium]|nr:homocysteine S-methyltransferase family protein [Candidatus Margulisiibacteriota bacterium]
MSKFLAELKNKVLIIDGAMGTQLMDRGVRPEDCFDAVNIKKPEIVEAVHKAYVEAGADIVETNTFGANRIKLVDYKLDNKVREINVAAAQLARKAIGEKGFVCGSIGPLGKMLEPLGETTFDQAYEAFVEQAKGLEEGGADVISIETISDLQEMRAAVVAVKNSTKLPIIASLTYDDGEKTVYGTTPEVAVAVLEPLGIDIISANCSTGPEGMLKVAKRYLAATKLPVMVMPNAGMPELVGNKAVYKMSPEKFASYSKKFVEMGVRIVGGCCGTSPEHIRAVKNEIRNTKAQTNLACRQAGPKSEIRNPKFASRTKVVEVKPGVPLLVGERINPTGRPAFQEEIRAGKTQIIRQEAETQTKGGADLLDVNISVHDISESEVMGKTVKVVQSVSEQPLSIDSPSRFAIEAGLKQFCGRALLNSVNGKRESIEQIIPLAKKYGAAIIALALDEHGIPQSADDRVRITERIVMSAVDKGISKDDIFVDCLVMTAGVGIAGCLETLKAIPVIKERLGVKTILGISNVSHGMPARSNLNALYFQLALAYGLDAAIVDVTDTEIQKAIKGLGRPMKAKKAEGDEGRKRLLEAFKAEVDKQRRSGKPAEKKREAVLKEIKLSGYQDIRKAVIDGDGELVGMLVKQGLAGKKFPPQKIIDQGLIPGMEIVGKKFSKKEYFLPQVIESAEAMKKGFILCQEKIPKGSKKAVGKVVLATVKGDIHDIGKNIVKMMLENHGFTVVDLGKDIPPEKIVEAAKKEKPNVIALSALLTTTMVEMGIVKDELKKAKLDIPLLVGGAVVTKGYADRIGAVYSMDAVGAVELAKKIMKAAGK